MSVTVEDLLKLPSLRDAEVVAGKGGLKKIVSSVSVLETINPSLLKDEYSFDNDAFLGSEIVITGFINAADNTEVQVENLRALAGGGEAGIILFYVGIIMKTIPAELISLADEMDFPVICMPKNQIKLRYGDIIGDISGAIFRDQMSEASMTVPVLEQVARLPQNQQTVENVLKLISIRLRASLILTDGQLRVLNEAPWPKNLENLYENIRPGSIPEPYGAPKVFPQLQGGLLYRATISGDIASSMELFVIRDGNPLTREELRQAAECVRLSVCIWSQNHEHVIIPELIKAILTDEPLKMRYLSSQLNIDIQSVHSMYVFSGAGFAAEHVKEISDYANKVFNTAFAGIYDGTLVLFSSDFNNNMGTDVFLENVEGLLPANVTKIVFPKLANIIDVRNAFESSQTFLNDAKKILPCRKYLSGSDIGFVRQCRIQVERGEESVQSALSVLNVLSEKKVNNDVENTLAVFLLDADQSVQKASELLFVHKNTVKYRIKCMSEILGYPVGRMPESNVLYIAVAIRRLLS